MFLSQSAQNREQVLYTTVIADILVVYPQAVLGYFRSMQLNAHLSEMLNMIVIHIIVIQQVRMQIICSVNNNQQAITFCFCVYYKY